MPLHRPLLLACAAAALSLPAVAPTVAQEGASDSRRIEGSATYMARIALPDDARMQLEARSPFGDSLALEESATEGAQVPLPFAVEVPPGQEVQLAIALLSGPDTLWVSGLVDVASGEGTLALGDVELRPFQLFGAGAELLCGDNARYRIGFSGDDALLVTSVGAVPLSVQISASGARYASDDGRTQVWTKADRALVTLDGVEQGECRFVPPSQPEVWTGTGQEPGWMARVAGGRLELTRQAGEGLDVALSPGEIRDGAFHYSGTDANGAEALQVVLEPGVCRDTMSGMPHPEALQLHLGEEVLQGCGGDPLALLTGPEWQVEDIGGAGIIDNSHVTLQIGTGGQVAGSGGCNRFFGKLQMSGEGIGFGPLGSTSMACAEALMNQEHHLHEALATVTGFNIDETGALLLQAGDETAILLRR